MTSPFDALANRLGVDELNAFAVEHDLNRADPAWAGAVVLIPVLEAFTLERKRIEALSSRLPEAADLGRSIAQAATDYIVLEAKERVTDETIPLIERLDTQRAAMYDLYRATIGDLSRAVLRINWVTIGTVGIAFGVGALFGYFLPHVTR